MDKEAFFITGIGASAGGTEALKSFFGSIGDDPGTAFIVIQHLAINQKGFTGEVLKGITPLPISQVEGRTKVLKNHIYLIPPQYYLLLEDRHLVVKRRDPQQKVNDAIDVFFCSLADQAAEKAVGIIFSGLGSDGAKGARHIKEGGGIVMVQSPDSAPFGSMPMEAIMSDHPDVIDSPENVAGHLLHFIKNPGDVAMRPENVDMAKGDAVHKVISLINEFSGVNFRDYKTNTVTRRIDKRAKINYLGNADEYLKLLVEKPDEIRVLYKDMLIGVTEFFRDREAFEILREKVIPELCSAEKEFGTVRIWVPACSTGEEAYSIAMLVNEHIQKNNLHLDFKIFASDLDPKAVELSRRGRYSRQIELQVPGTLLNTYFNRNGDFYEISNEIRTKIIFSVHNLLNDPPYIRMDFISCRNLFIYLKEEARKKILYTFNYALRDQGFLMIGANETHSDLNGLFEEVDSRWRIFKNRQKPKDPRNRIIQSEFFSNQRYRQSPPPLRRNTVAVDEQQELFAELILEKYAPDCILLTEENRVVYVTGKAENFLFFPKKKENLNFFEMVRDNFSLALRGGLRSIREEQRNVVLRNINAQTNSMEFVVVDIFLYSIYSNNTSRKYILVEIKPGDENRDDQEFIEVSSRESLREIERLEAELLMARKELRSVSDELETINEELQSSNEEMKSSNEELQTTNEELQSANEELKSVNSELKTKIGEISVLHYDVENLFISTQIATLFMDRDLNIRKFTPSVKTYFNIRENDIGRPIYHFTHNLNYGELEEDARKVLRTLLPLEKKTATDIGHALVRILPYKTDNMRIGGIVLTIVDVTQLEKANMELKQMASALQNRTRELEQSEKYWKSLIENTPDVVARLDRNGRILFVNQSLYAHTGIPSAQLIGRTLPELDRIYHLEELEMIGQKLAPALKNNRVVNFYENPVFGEETKNFFVTAIPEPALPGYDETILLIARDITDLRFIEFKLKEKNRVLEEMNQYMDSFVHAVAHDLRAPLTNMKLILELVADEQTAEKREILIQKLDHTVARIDGTLNGLIEIIDSQVNASEKDRLVKFATVVSKALEDFREDIPEDARVDVSIEVEEIQHVKGYISSIVRNLLSNSIKYRRRDIPLVIRIETKKEGGYTLLSVADNGIGMDFDHIKNDLFKPFKRFTTVGDGIGIGLHVLKSMVEKTGGKIEVDSEEGKGTKFFIYLKDRRDEHSDD